jgi:hypothetical protein
MSFFEATTFFKEALAHIDGNREPATWNMLNGLIKLSESSQHLETQVRTVERDVGQMSRDIRAIKKQ